MTTPTPPESSKELLELIAGAPQYGPTTADAAQKEILRRLEAVHDGQPLAGHLSVPRSILEHVLLSLNDHRRGCDQCAELRRLVYPGPPELTITGAPLKQEHVDALTAGSEVRFDVDEDDDYTQSDRFKRLEDVCASLGARGLALSVMVDPVAAQKQRVRRKWVVVAIWRVKP